MPKTEDPNDQCPYCDRYFPRCLMRHIRVHVSMRPYECRQCFKHFNSDAEMRSHANQIHPTKYKYKCEICNKTYFTMGALNEHRDTHDVTQTFNCHICDKEVMRDYQSNHMTLHEGNMQAEESTAATAATGTSTESKPAETKSKLKFECPICKKELGDMKSLRRHWGLHIFNPSKKGMQYKCKCCRRIFSRESTLFGHLTNSGKCPLDVQQEEKAS